MVRLLQRTQAQNESWLTKLSGPRFRGYIFPIRPEAVPTTNFAMARHAMRTRLKEPVAARDLFRDSFRRVFLVAEHDLTSFEGFEISKLYALVQMTERVSWTRRTETVHPVTKQKIAGGTPAELGPIWIALEPEARPGTDPGVNVNVLTKRVLTAAMLQVGDTVAGQTVKSVNQQRGITIAEVQ